MIRKFGKDKHFLEEYAPMGQIGFGLVMLDLGLKESYNVLLIVIQTMS